MDINELFAGKYLRAVDLKGSEPTLTISHCGIEEFKGRKGEKEMKAILYFQGKEKGLGLNKTNANTMAMLYGPDTDGWPGCAITLYTIMTEYEGKPTQAIRIKAPKRAAAGAPPKPAPQEATADDEVPF